MKKLNCILKNSLLPMGWASAYKILSSEKVFSMIILGFGVNIVIGESVLR